MVSGHVSTKPEDRQSILIAWFVFDFPTFLNLKKKKTGLFLFWILCKVSKGVLPIVDPPPRLPFLHLMCCHARLESAAHSKRVATGSISKVAPCSCVQADLQI